MTVSSSVEVGSPSSVDRPKRVLVVDDSVVVRMLVAEVLRADPGFELAGVAANGRIALDCLDRVQPDVVVLDVEMPELDGLQTLAEIRRRNRTLPVVMFSTLTSRGATATIEALTLGASDYVQKPSTGSRDQSLAVLRTELLPRLHALVRRPRAVPPAPRPRGPVGTSRVDVVVIGVSTGGPNALADVLPCLPADLPVPVLVVQHMPVTFTRMLAERLDRLCPLAVAEAQGGEVVLPGTVWLAPGGQHLAVERRGVGRQLVTHDGDPVNSCRPAVDVLFEAAVGTYGAGVLAVVMTGMGQDGLRGCESVKAAGGQIVAQDEASSVVWGMPRFVAQAGLAEAVLPLDQLAAEITRRVRVAR